MIQVHYNTPEVNLFMNKFKSYSLLICEAYNSGISTGGITYRKLSRNFLLYFPKIFKNNRYLKDILLEKVLTGKN